MCVIRTSNKFLNRLNRCTIELLQLINRIPFSSEIPKLPSRMLAGQKQQFKFKSSDFKITHDPAFYCCTLHNISVSCQTSRSAHVDSFAIHLQSCNHAIHANVVMNLKRQISRKIDGVNLLHAMIFI